MYISTKEMVISIICNACGVLGLILWAIEAHKSNASQRIQSVKSVENSSEFPNNCEYAENPSGDVWECGCFRDTYCEHQIYDRNPDGTINIVECGYEPKDEQTRSKMEQVEDEPQTEGVANDTSVRLQRQ